jgi:hypothetical protein
MMHAAHVWYTDVWSKGDLAAVERVAVDDVVFRDTVWAAQPAPVVGTHALQSLVADWRTQVCACLPLRMWHALQPARGLTFLYCMSYLLYNTVPGHVV